MQTEPFSAPPLLWTDATPYMNLDILSSALKELHVHTFPQKPPSSPHSQHGALIHPVVTNQVQFKELRGLWTWIHVRASRRGHKSFWRCFIFVTPVRSSNRTKPKKKKKEKKRKVFVIFKHRNTRSPIQNFQITQLGFNHSLTLLLQIKRKANKMLCWEAGALMLLLYTLTSALERRRRWRWRRRRVTRRQRVHSHQFVSWFKEIIVIKYMFFPFQSSVEKSFGSHIVPYNEFTSFLLYSFACRLLTSRLCHFDTVSSFSSSLFFKW